MACHGERGRACSSVPYRCMLDILETNLLRTDSGDSAKKRLARIGSSIRHPRKRYQIYLNGLQKYTSGHTSICDRPLDYTGTRLQSDLPSRHVLVHNWLQVLLSGVTSCNVRRPCLLRRLVHLWGARAKHAVLMRVSSNMLPQRAACFSDGPIRNHRSWPTPRLRWTGFALRKTRNRLNKRQEALQDAEHAVCTARRGTRRYQHPGGRSGYGEPGHDQGSVPAGRPGDPAPLWHVAGAGHASARRTQPEDRGRGRDSGPAGRALCGHPEAEVHGRWCSYRLWNERTRHVHRDRIICASPGDRHDACVTALPGCGSSCVAWLLPGPTKGVPRRRAYSSV